VLRLGRDRLFGTSQFRAANSKHVEHLANRTECIVGAEEQQVEMGNPEKRLDEARAQRENQEGTEKPEVTDEHKEKAKEMAKVYNEDRPTSVLPDTGGTVAGTIVSDWLDEDKTSNANDDEESEADDGKNEKQDA
jgi:hypothetical protein